MHASMFKSCEISRSSSSHDVFFIIFSYFLITNPNLINSVTQKNRYCLRRLKMANFLKQCVVKIAQCARHRFHYSQNGNIFKKPRNTIYRLKFQNSCKLLKDQPRFRLRSSAYFNPCLYIRKIE